MKLKALLTLFIFLFCSALSAFDHESYYKRSKFQPVRFRYLLHLGYGGHWDYLYGMNSDNPVIPFFNIEQRIRKEPRGTELNYFFRIASGVSLFWNTDQSTWEYFLDSQTGIISFNLFKELPLRFLFLESISPYIGLGGSVARRNVSYSAVYLPDLNLTVDSRTQQMILGGVFSLGADLIVVRDLLQISTGIDLHVGRLSYRVFDGDHSDDGRGNQISSGDQVFSTLDWKLEVGFYVF